MVRKLIIPFFHQIIPLLELKKKLFLLEPTVGFSYHGATCQPSVIPAKGTPQAFAQGDNLGHVRAMSYGSSFEGAVMGDLLLKIRLFGSK
ncbi:MAG: hypothetical protein WCL14_04890 [Bacteroidota bacterium]